MFIIGKITTYADIQEIIAKGLPRIIYLPLKLAKRAGHEVYITLCDHDRIMFHKKLVKPDCFVELTTSEADVLQALISLAKEQESYIKLRGKYLDLKGIIKEMKFTGHTPRTIEAIIYNLIKAGYLDEIVTENETKYRLTDKVILPDRQSEKFTVIGV